LGLFFTIDEADAGNYFCNHLGSLQPAPMFLSFQAKLEHHRQGQAFAGLGEFDLVTADELMGPTEARAERLPAGRLRSG